MKTLESDSLKKEILSELKAKLGATSFRSLAQDLAKDAIPENNVFNIVGNVFLKNNLKRANIFSKRFVNVLKKLAVIYELQRR
jgi:hypothetical protein